MNSRGPARRFILAPGVVCPCAYRTKAAGGGPVATTRVVAFIGLRVHYARKAARRFTSSQVDAGPLLFVSAWKNSKRG